MAGEISLLNRMKLSNGLLKTEFATGQLSLDQSAAVVYDAVHAIGTSEESIGTFGDVSSEGLCFLYNLDDTNYVQWGFATTVYGGRLKPAHAPAQFNCESGLTLYLKADTAACNVRVIVLDA